ncbi:hypothetical protein T05_14834 [Trichinella murrelli]|uniref:Transmembrane protein n=1 Tax=Trichinella murrelli TaxID=144512 RepID=A0A0V0T8B3_9BILA|nr:hypothetical protein T05_14834 [Trichinella murrelli]
MLKTKTEQISLSQSSSVRTNPVTVLVIAAVSAFAILYRLNPCSHGRKPSRPSVPLLITNSQRRNSILFMTAMKYVKRMVFNVLVRNCEEESRILNDLHRIT